MHASLAGEKQDEQVGQTNPWTLITGATYIEHIRGTPPTPPQSTHSVRWDSCPAGRVHSRRNPAQSPLPSNHPGETFYGDAYISL